MPAEILSLDLDWFNLIGDHDGIDRQEFIQDFFAQLKTKCTLPKTIDFVPEHQYLYPWSLKILNGLTYRKINVVNIDEHHDFYCIEDIHDFDDEKAEVGCWNFFAFMAHRGLLGKYLWVTNETTKTAVESSRRELFRGLREGSYPVRQYKQIKVVSVDKVFNAVRGKRFDGFLIIRSPRYTRHHRSVYYAVDQALKTKLPRTKVRRYQCRINFSNGRVHHRANSLFWKL